MDLFSAESGAALSAFCCDISSPLLATLGDGLFDAATLQLDRSLRLRSVGQSVDVPPVPSRPCASLRPLHLASLIGHVLKYRHSASIGAG